MKAPKLAKGQSRSGLARDAAGEETEAPFLMGLLTDTVESDVPRAQLKTLPGAVLPLPAALQGAGVRHVLKIGPTNKVLATFPDEQPALVQVPVGQGAVYYLAIPLVPASMAELMNAVLAAGGVYRPVRFLTPDGAHVPGLEYRAIKTADGWLAYVNNLDRKNDKQLKLATSHELSGIRNLTLETDLPLSFTLPAGEIYILRLNANQSK
jgi:hypothetical protein